ncbi:nucleotidyltransferase family protein [Propionivibrio sp.]|uniref:nucleotidyltransferase family protein n=1 Tax=Propionivibrio sp. TaxID=2212460 RepID=UPI003BEF96B0
MHRSEIRHIVEKNDAINPRVFGSAIHGDDTEESDLDLLVDPIQGETTLMSLVSIEMEVSALIGMKVDVQTPLALSARFRNEVLHEAVPL